MTRLKMAITAGLTAGSLAVAGCSGMSDTERRGVSGTAIGAAGGAAVGAIAGNTGLGLAIGAASGLAGGLIYDNHKKSQEREYQEGYDAGKAAK